MTRRDLELVDERNSNHAEIPAHLRAHTREQVRREFDFVLMLPFPPLVFFFLILFVSDRR